MHTYPCCLCALCMYTNMHAHWLSSMERSQTIYGTHFRDFSLFPHIRIRIHPTPTARWPEGPGPGPGLGRQAPLYFILIRNCRQAGCKHSWQWMHQGKTTQSPQWHSSRLEYCKQGNKSSKCACTLVSAPNDRIHYDANTDKENTYFHIATATLIYLLMEMVCVPW